MALSKAERQKIEMKGVPYVVAAIVTDWEIEIENIEMVTEKLRQYKGEDFIASDNVGSAVIDSKFHIKKAYKQEYTEYGVDVLSIEITKHNGRKGWGINEALNTDYIIDMIYDVGYYVIDAKRLKEYMKECYTEYPVMYSSKGKEDYRAVSVADLIEYEIILYYKEFSEIENMGLKYERGYSEEYNKHIQPHISKLLTE